MTNCHGVVCVDPPTQLYCFRFPGPSSEMVTYEPHDVMVDISAVAVSTRTAADGGQVGRREEGGGISTPNPPHS